jgi:hypothetical protein
MRIILILLITAAAIAGIVWAVITLTGVYYNIKTLRYASHNPSISKQKQGIIYNKKTKKLEADQSPITPF